MELHEILAHVDHTLLKQDATWEQIQTIVDEGMEYQTASVCIPASYVKRAADYIAGCGPEGRVKICTVIGFPQRIFHHRRQVLRNRRSGEKRRG